MYGCAFLAFLFLFFSVAFGVPIARHFFLSGSGQRLVFLITFFSLHFSFHGCLSRGFFYIHFGSHEVYSISISVWGSDWRSC